MPLYLDTAHRSSVGTNRGEESCLVVIPRPEQENTHGTLVAVAEGLADAPSPESAARQALKAFGQAYYATPENWGLKHALYESIAAANTSLLTDQDEPGRAAALTVLILRRRRWALVHAGHTRAWQLHENEIKLLTRDHVEPRVQRAPRVVRACGLSARIDPQFLVGELCEGDVFVLSSPGVHDVLSGAQILACLVADASAKQMAAMVVEKTVAGARLARGSACVVRVEQVPQETQTDLEEDVITLPPMAPPDIGDTVDGFRIERLLHKSSRHRLYKATDLPTGQVVALKFPNPKDAADPAFAEQFLREEWIGRRVTSAHLLRTLALRKGRRTALYSVLAYPSGESLARKLGRKGTLGLHDTAFIGGQLLEALTELHNQGVVHNDIRPQNIVLEKNAGHLVLLGLGGSHLSHGDTLGSDTLAGSRRGNFLAPELFEPGAEPTVRTDIFSAGVTIYRTLTGGYPYGKIAGAGEAPHGEYAALDSYRSDATPALDAVLRRACALDARERFDSAQDFADALETAVSRHTNGEKKTTGRKNRAWENALVIVVILALALFLVYTLKR